MSIAPAAMRRLMKELVKFRTTPPDGIRVFTNEENVLDITGIIAGPEGTPYEGGYFKVKFQFTEEFPNVPPKCTLLTKIFHPNVSKAGEICVNTLKKDWKREYGIEHILVTIKCLLIYPNAESALDEAAGKLLLEDYNEYFKHARLITSIHATPKVRPAEFDTPSDSSADGSSALDITPGPSSNRSATAPIPERRVESNPRAPLPPPPIMSSTTQSHSSDPLQHALSNAHASLSTHPHLPGSIVSPSLLDKPFAGHGPLQPSSGTNGSLLAIGSKPSIKASVNGPIPVTSNSTTTPSSSGGTGNQSLEQGARAGVKRSAAVSGVNKRKRGLKRL